jgi:hypothetical protein
VPGLFRRKLPVVLFQRLRRPKNEAQRGAHEIKEIDMTKLLLALILSLPMVAFAAEHGGTAAEHGGKPAEHGGAPAEAAPEEAAEAAPAAEHGGAAAEHGGKPAEHGGAAAEEKPE